MAHAHALEGLMKFVRREEWHAPLSETLDLHVGPVCAKFGVGFEELCDLIGDQRTSVLWGCVFEDLLARQHDDGRNIVDDYLKRRGWKESASDKAYMVGLRSSVMSLYEISDIVLDQSFLARDLVRGGDPVRVSERSGTRYLKPWDRIAARLVQVGPRVLMSGGAMPFDFDASELVLEELRPAIKQARVAAGKSGRSLRSGADAASIADALSDTDVLRAAAFVFTNLWLGDLLERTLHPRLPQLRNTEGDEIAFTTISYPLEPATGVDAIRRALAAIPSLRRESETFWNWIGAQPPARKKQRPDGEILITARNDGELVLGTVELKGQALVLEANSPQRAQRGRELIGPLLQGLVGEPAVASRTVAQLMASRPGEQSAKPSSGLSPAEERAVLEATLDRHYATLLDERVPMLGNMTPRRAAQSAKGREKLVAWLKLLENTNASQERGSVIGDYDVTWLWQELGVLDLRR